MGKLSKALGMDVGMEDEGSFSPETEVTVEVAPEKKAASAEVLAMKMFERAKSPEDKAAALKDFLSACGYMSDEE
jgi:hypothetical protein